MAFSNPVFPQKTDTGRLLNEANENLYKHPEKSIKLYNYILKNPLTPELKTTVLLKKIEAARLLGTYQKAVNLFIALRKRHTNFSNDSLNFSHWLQTAHLLKALDLETESQKALTKAKEKYPELPKKLREEYSTDLELLVLDHKAEPQTTVEINILKNALNHSYANHKRSWYLYQIGSLYNGMNQDSAKYYLNKISEKQNLPLTQIVAVKKAILNNQPITSLSKKMAHGLFYDNELKIPLLIKAIHHWENKKNIDSISKYTQQLEQAETSLNLDKRKAKVNLLEHTFKQKNKIQKQEKGQKKMYLRIAISLLSFLILLFFVYSKYRKRKQRLSQSTVVDPKSKIIPHKTEVEILKKIGDFEDSQLYLNPKMRIALLAKHLETNTRYLSTIINASKDKSFNAYINSLRIQYIIGKLNSTPKYLTYKISYLAKESGFASQSSFTTAFKEETGLTPSVYIKNIT
ncbi:MAG: helix-turn-helix domain-containing protein [Flavobacteriaceae bacterium]